MKIPMLGRPDPDKKTIYCMKIPMLEGPNPDKNQ